jgi:hypothetical protein
LFKNPNDDSDRPSATNLEDILKKDLINSILYSDPFIKAGFLSTLVKDAQLDILYLDLDLLYSGYLVSGILSTRENIELFQPTSDTLYQIISKILTKASLTPNMIIIDSLNGLFNILNRKKKVGKTVMSIVMLLTSIAKMTNSFLVIAGMVRYKKEEGWILSPIGKRLIETKHSKKIHLEYREKSIVLNIPSNSSQLVIPLNHITLV